MVGVSTAYGLAEHGRDDVVLLKQNELMSRTTWYPAGRVTQASATDGVRQVVRRSLEVFRKLEVKTGFSTLFVDSGTINTATSSDRMDQHLHLCSAVRSSGVEAQLIDTEGTQPSEGRQSYLLSRASTTTGRSSDGVLSPTPFPPPEAESSSCEST